MSISFQHTNLSTRQVPFVSDPIRYSRNSYSDRALSIVSKDLENEHLAKKALSQVEKIPQNKKGEYELDITIYYKEK